MGNHLVFKAESIYADGKKTTAELRINHDGSVVAFAQEHNEDNSPHGDIYDLTIAELSEFQWKQVHPWSQGA